MKKKIFKGTITKICLKCNGDKYLFLSDGVAPRQYPCDRCKGTGKETEKITLKINKL